MIKDKLALLLRSAEVLSSEYILVLAIVLLVVLEIINPDRKNRLSQWLTLFTSIVVLANVFNNVNAETIGYFFQRHIELTGYVYLAEIGFSISLFFVILFNFIRNEEQPGEYYILLLGATLGAHIMVAANSLLTLYIGIELLSLCSYLLTTFSFEKRSFEGGIKYLVFGSVSTAFMLYGISMVYGLTGEITLNAVQLAAETSPLAIVYIFLIIGGILFKISAFPFHIWVPDVYQVAPIGTTAFFSVVPKVSGAIVLVNILSKVIFLQEGLPLLLFSLVVLGSIIIGNFSALRQSNLRRLLAYSSIAHAGFIMIGLFVVPGSYYVHLSFYLYVYMFMNLAIFYLVGHLEANGIKHLEQLNGLGRKNALLGILATIVLISLAGLPPTAGFTGKLLIFSTLWETYSSSNQNILLVLFVFGLISAVVSLYYYIKIAFHMFIKDDQEDTVIDFPLYGRLTAFTLTIPLLIFFAKPDFLLKFINTIISLGG